MKNHIKAFSNCPTIYDIRWAIINTHIHQIIENPSKIQFIKEYKWVFSLYEMFKMFNPSDNTVDVLYFEYIQNIDHDDLRIMANASNAKYILDNCSERYILKRLNRININNVGFKGRSKKFIAEVRKHENKK